MKTMASNRLKATKSTPRVRSTRCQFRVRSFWDYVYFCARPYLTVRFVALKFATDNVGHDLAVHQRFRRLLWPETLEVLYRMRPTVSVQVGSVLRGASDTAV